MSDSRSPSRHLLIAYTRVFAIDASTTLYTNMASRPSQRQAYNASGRQSLFTCSYAGVRHVLLCPLFPTVFPTDQELKIRTRWAEIKSHVQTKRAGSRFYWRMFHVRQQQKTLQNLEVETDRMKHCHMFHNFEAETWNNVTCSKPWEANRKQCHNHEAATEHNVTTMRRQQKTMSQPWGGNRKQRHSHEAATEHNVTTMRRPQKTMSQPWGGNRKRHSHGAATENIVTTMRRQQKTTSQPWGGNRKQCHNHEAATEHNVTTMRRPQKAMSQPWGGNRKQRHSHGAATENNVTTMRRQQKTTSQPCGGNRKQRHMFHNLERWWREVEQDWQRNRNREAGPGSTTLCARFTVAFLSNLYWTAFRAEDQTICHHMNYGKPFTCRLLWSSLWKRSLCIEVGAHH